MAAFSTNVAAVLVKYNGQSNPSACGDYVGEIKLDADTGSCFILYPEESNQPGKVLACEVSTYKVDDAGRETGLVLQTIADRELTNVCKLIPGHCNILKIFTAYIPCNPRDVGHDIELDSLTTRIYCRSSCIKNPKLWSPSVAYVPGNTIWNGGPCQLVCKKDYKPIQLFYYDRIYEIESGVYIFELTGNEEINIVWNTLPIAACITDEFGHLDNLVVEPVSFVIVPSCWMDVISKLTLVDGEQHFKSKDKRAMSLANYYLNDDIDGRDKLILARIHNDQLKFESMNLQLTLDFMTLLFLTVLILFLTLLVVY